MPVSQTWKARSRNPWLRVVFVLLIAALTLALFMRAARGCAPETNDEMSHPASIEALIGPAVYHAMLDWIAGNTSYDIKKLNADPPTIHFSDVGSVISYQGQSLIVDRRLSAAYDSQANRIYLKRPWSAADTSDLSTLLHELVHALQLSSRAWPCANATEWQAYKLQEAWLQDHGVEPTFDWLKILISSQCRPDIHP